MRFTYMPLERSRWCTIFNVEHNCSKTFVFIQLEDVISCVILVSMFACEGLHYPFINQLDIRNDKCHPNVVRVSSIYIYIYRLNRTCNSTTRWIMWCEIFVVDSGVSTHVSHICLQSLGTLLFATCPSRGGHSCHLDNYLRTYLFTTLIIVLS